MAIDPSAVARVLGIATEYKDLRGGAVAYLPQRIAVFAQGETGVSFPATKWQATSAGAGGSRYGFRSPIYQILKELMPINGDGVGTIPVTIYPMVNAGGGSAPSVGGISVSGTATAAGAYRVRIAGVLSEQFVIPVGAVNASRDLAAIGNAINAVLGMPMLVSYTYGSVTAGALVGTGNGTLTALTAPGTPMPGDWTLTVNTAVANGGVWTLRDPLGNVVSTTITMTPGVGGATVINAGGLQFTLTDGTTDFGLGAVFTITVPATALVLTSGWHGTSANDLVIEVIGESLGVTFAITQPVGGLVNPDVSSALALVGNVWESMAINGLNIEDTVALDDYQVFGEGRWGELVRKPLVVFTGNTEAVVADATAISSPRRTDRVNSQLTAPGSVNLPCVVAARQVARIAKLANENPPHDYGSQQATGLIPGADGVQWDFVKRDQAVKAGSSTSEVKDGVVNISDVVTFYRPTGEEPPAYRHVVDIVKLQQCIYNFDLRFATAEWDGAPLIPDDQATVNPKAKKPKMAKAVVAGIVDNLALEAIISDGKTAKKSINASINSMNPKRLDFDVTVQLSGNTNVKSATLRFGFFFGTQAVVG
jgi:phage tail sheath gpL-like